MRLQAGKLGIASGLVWGFSLFFLTFVNMWTGYATEFLIFLSSVYPGYHVSFSGALIGLVYAFFDGFVALFLIAWVYNKLCDN